MKPKLFIGSASESINIVEELQSQLGNEIIVEPWTKSFHPGHYTLEELVIKASSVDFAAFVLGTEDKTESQGNSIISPRDNVVYEAGLFAGHLGRDRVFLLLAEGTKMPTDWKGLGYIAFDPSNPDVTQMMRPTSKTIREEILDWKKRIASSIEEQILGSWWQYVINRNEGAVVSLLSVRRSNNKSPITISGESWTNEGKNIAKYWSRAVSYDNRDSKLFYYWEGDHPNDSSIPKFVGVGEIHFAEMDAENITKVDGWYSDSPLNQLNETVRKSAEYFRANEEEIQIMKNGNHSSIKNLIVSHCEKLKEMINTR